MTKIKRLVSVILAVLMIFGSVSVAAFAWDATTDDGFNLDITTKIFREVNGEWVETEKVNKGENVKARVYLNTDYYTNSGQLLFFYDSDFFTDSFGTGYETLTVNPYYTASPYGISGKFISSKSSSNIEDSLVNSGKITSEFADSHEFVFATYSFSSTAKNQMLSNSNWFCEFPLTVKDDASGIGDFFALEETTASASFTKGKINVPKGPFNGYNENVVHMSSWDAVLNYTSQPVTLFTNFVTVTFDAGAGEFSDGTSSIYFEGDAGETLTVEEPTRTNFRFAGWKLTGADDSTASEVTAFPAASSTYEAVWTSTTASSEVLTFKTEFYRQDPSTGEWIATTRVKPGEVVKARLFVDTSYFTNAGEILLFYDNDFFTDAYATNSPTDLSVNPDPESSASINGVNGKSTKLLTSGTIISGLVSNGYISQSFADSHQAISISYAFKPSTGKKISGEKWFVEFDLQVRSTASGTGDIFVVEDTIMNSGSGVKAYINLPLSTDGGEPMNSIAMHLWDVNAVIESNPVSTFSSVTFRANGGAFDADDTETYVVNGDIGDAVDASAIPAISKAGATFIGWVPSTVENPTISDVVAVPSEIPYDDLILDALWIDEVDITFVLNNGQDPIVQTVTSGDDFVAPEDPALEGNFFVGWTSDSTYKTITGLPDVYPSEDTTYYAVFETNSYIVKYFILNNDTSTFDNIGEVSISYGENIPHIPPYYSVPTGYTISEAYTDASFETLLAADAKMPAKTVEVYYKTVAKAYDAVFDAGEGTFDDGASTATVSVEYGSIIVAPVAPTRDGYEFAGWDPEVGYMDAEGKTFNAIWTPKTYTATYLVDGAIYDVFELACGQDMEKPVPPYVEGYTFKGWSPEVPDTMPASNQVFNAVLEPKTYVATFEAGEGKFADDTVTVTVPTVFNTEIAVPTAPTRDGYDFAGWTPVVPAAMPAENMTFTATWTARDDTPYTVEIYTMDTTGAYGTPDVLNKTGTTDKVVEITTVAPDGFYIDTTDSILSDTVAADGTTVLKVYLARNEYTISFNANNGEFTDSSDLISGSYYHGAIVSAPVPTREGYTFLGWDKTVSTVAVASVNYVAQWEINQYTITFGDTGDTVIDPITQDYGTAITAPEDPTKEGYTFDGWDAEIPATMPAGDMTITAQWTINQYTITFAETGDAVIDPITQDYGTAITAPEDPTKVGYTFKGWDVEIPATMPAGDMTITGQWEINQYTITFGDTGDTVIDPITQDYGTAITAPEDPTKEGYTFDGWDAEIPATMPAGDMTITAQWTINQYTITFAEIGDAVIDPITQDYGTAITAPEDPTKVGYTFKGWDVEIPATMPAGDMTITGQWEINQYTITFGDTGDTVIDPITQDYGTAITAPDEPTKEGYTFTGWVDENGDPTDIPATMPAESKTINAQWQINQYTITFAETGDSVIDPITQDYGTAITAPEDPTMVGYTFKGWDVEIPATMPAGDMTITGQWEINQYTITFADTGDSVIAPITQDYDTEITIPENPTKEGYTFAGWVDENGDPTTIPDYMPAENLTITATWNVRSYPVRYTVDGETYYGPTVTAYGSTIVEPAVPTKPGYTFAGWLDASGKKPSDYGTMPAKALEFIAQWTPNANVGYIIEVYEMGTDGTYPSTPTITYTMKDGVVGDTREFEATVPTGFALDNTNSVLSGTIPATGTLVLKAYYERNSHTLKTVVDGVETDTTVYYGAVIPAQAAPVKEGYDFAGWVDVNGDPTVIPAVMPDNDVTVYAAFTVKSYTAEYIVDGVVVANYDVEFGAAIPQPADPDVEGMEFKGWTPAVPDTMPSSDLTFTAVLEAKTYTATFNSNDGAFTDSSTSKTVDVKYGDAIAFAEEPTRTGYTFAGWAPSVPATMPAQNLTFEAQWAAEGDTPYKILTYTMDTAGNYGTPVETNKTGKSGEIVEVFTSATEGFTVASQSTLSAVLAADGSTVLTVYLARNQYTISFNANNGSITGSTDTTVSAQYYHGALVSAPSVEREGYTFKGWNPSLNITATGNANYAAQWEINEYTITFDTDGGSAVAPITQDYGTAINAPADPVKEGYTFAGWVDENGDPADIPATMPAGDMTVTAQWDIDSYKVTWNVDGVLTEEDYEYGAAIVEPATPVKTGYVFAGWAPNVPATMPARDLEFVATWTEATDTAYTVETYVMDKTGNYVKSVQNLTGTTNAEVEAKYTVPTGFVLNDTSSVLTGTVAADGSLVLKVYLDRQSYKFSTCVDGVITSTTNYLYGATVLTPSEPSKTGYTFSGWVNAVTGETVDFTNVVTMPAADMTVNATWTVNSYTVTFRDRGVILKTDTYNYGDVITVISDPVRDGYTFAGWSPAVPATMPANNINTNAIWTANEYSIIFDTDGGSEVDPITQAVGTDIFDIPDDPTKEGYDFAGWVDENGDPADIPATMPIGGMTLTATWDPIEYTITFGDTGDTVIDPITQDYGTPVTAPTDPTKEGYTFTGWSEEIPATMPAENKTINAQWEINQYTITFDTDGGSAIAPITQDYGTPVTAPENPTKEGYTFASWSEEIPATMPAENKTLTASWTVNTYTVTWNNEGTKTTADYNYGDTIVLPETPVKDGYTFFGWFDENGLQPSNYVTMPAKDIEFEARFTPNGNSSYIIEVYEMGTDGTFASTPSSAYTHSDGIVGNTKTVTPEVPYGFTLNTEKSVLSGVIPATGTLVLKVYYDRNLHTLTTDVDGTETDYDYYYNAVVTPVADPVKDGYVFAGWVDADDNATAIPTVMPDSDVKVYATWTNDSYTATFNAGEGIFGDGSSSQSSDVPFGGDITPPAVDPTREGYDFGGWATADDPETPVTDFGTMGVGDREYVAIWTKSSFKITFYNYKPADGGPNAPTVKYALATADYKYGETIDFPTDPSFDYYIFLGWSETEGDSTNLITSADTITMPAHDYNLYAVYEKVKVMLIPKNDTCTTVIDRNGGTVDDYTDDSEWYVYGLEEYLTEDMLLDKYIDVQGDGRIEIIPVDVNFGPYRGTGTIINVYDRNGTAEKTDDRFVESFRVIIFGDLNGDAIIRSVDSTIVDKEVSGLTSWHLDYSDEYCAYMVKAADVSKDTFITSVDATLIDRKVIGIATIDQVTGLAS